MAVISCFCMERQLFFCTYKNTKSSQYVVNMVLLIKVYANKGAIIISEKRKRIHQRKHLTL